MWELLLVLFFFPSTKPATVLLSVLNAVESTWKHSAYFQSILKQKWQAIFCGSFYKFMQYVSEIILDRCNQHQILNYLFQVRFIPVGKCNLQTVRLLFLDMFCCMQRDFVNGSSIEMSKMNIYMPFLSPPGHSLHG